MIYLIKPKKLKKKLKFLVIALLEKNPVYLHNASGHARDYCCGIYEVL